MTNLTVTRTMKRLILMTAFALGLALQAGAQRFFNLTADQLRIDSLLPVFTHAFPLDGAFRDSAYRVAIEYPEYVEMTAADVSRYLHADAGQRRALVGDSLPDTPEVNLQLGIDRKRGTLSAWLVPIVFRDGRYRKLVSFKLAVTATARHTGAALRPSGRGGVAQAEAGGAGAGERYAGHSVLAQGQWAKIRVPWNGVYELTADVVRAAGFSDISKVKIYGYGGALQPEVLQGDYLKETDDLKEVAQCVAGGRRLFYGRGPVYWNAGLRRVRNPYSNYGYYFLTESDSAPLTVDSTAFVSAFYPSGDDTHTLYEVDSYSWYSGGRNLFDAQPLEQDEPHDYTLDAANAAEGGFLRVVVSSDNVSAVTVAVNDSVVGTVSVGKLPNYSKANSGEAVFTLPRLAATNKVTLTKTSGNMARLDYIDLRCRATKAAPELSRTAFPAPEYVYRITNQDMHAHQPVDMVIIIPTTQKLLAQASRLKALHEQRDSMTVRIVPADELFNEFSSGTPDATAYKRYMKMLYDRAPSAEEAPKYLVMFGDGAWDNRMCLTGWSGCSPDDFLLCYESENSFSETQCLVSDDFFCLLDDNERLWTEGNDYSYTGITDVAVGRFPVRTDGEAKIMVDKIEAYMDNKAAGSWQNTLVFMGDDGNNNAHMADANTAARIVEQNWPGYEVKRVFWDSYKRTSTTTGYAFPEAEAQVKHYMDNGALIMDYSGHGAPYMMSNEKVLVINDFKNANCPNLPLWITASCDIMPFDGQTDNIGETAILNPNGGAIAFYGTTRTVFQAQNAMMNQAYLRRVLDTSNGGMGMGEAARQAKNSLVTGTSTDHSVNRLQYTFLGDPALKLACPQLQMAIDSINGEPVAGGKTLEMKAGSAVTMTGRVMRAGQEVTDFDGLATAYVRDAEQTVVCYLWDTDPETGSQSAYVYTDYPNYIYKGQDSIRNGRFAINFAVPKDIQYSAGNGMVNIYGVNGDHSAMAHGHTSALAFRGSAAQQTDSIGPSVYCYLNSSSFVNGGEVNATPYFIAEVYDESGINAAGSSVGHDIQLVVDGRQDMTYNLNDHFAYDFGTYRQGKVGYSLPRLAIGPHRLSFRVWDILNNSSTAELAFNVVEAQEPQLLQVDCTHNPAVTSTAFRIVHDRVGSNVEVVVDVLDMAGRLLWTSAQNTVPESGVLEIDWDLTVGGGRPLGTGVYLYRVRMSSDGSGYASKAKKLVVIGRQS